MISIVDDDAVVREATADLINSLGYSSQTFESSEQFLASDKIKLTRCLIVDVQMPGLGGLELQGRLIAEGHETPIIFITGFPNDEAKARALRAGAIAYLSKPFHELSLIESLEIALNTRRA
jgi:FixJ family two-component response regulator